MSSYRKTTTQRRVNRQWLPPSVKGLDFASVTTSLEEKRVPLTVRRKKPTDLFLGFTSRRVSWHRGEVATYSRALLRWPNGERAIVTEAPTLGYSVSNLAQSPLRFTPPEYCDIRTLLAIKDQKVNLSVSLPELPKTINMVSKLLSESLSFLRSLRRGNLKSIIRSLKNPRTAADKEAAQRWLQYQYGIIPTIYDVYGLTELIHNKIRDGFIYGKVSHTDRTTFTETLSSLTTRFTIRVTRKNHYRYKVDSQKLNSLKQAGITNPALTVWELIPYSFVFDWFIPVGDYLSTLDALVGVTDLRVNRSRYYVEDYISTYHFNRDSSVEHVYSLASAKGRRVVSERINSVTSLQPRFPTYQPHLSMKRLTSAMSLIRVLFK